MPRPYINVEHLWEVVQKRKAAGETYRQIAQSYGLKMSQVKELACGLHRRVATGAFASGHPALAVAGFNQSLSVQS